MIMKSQRFSQGQQKGTSEVDNRQKQTKMSQSRKRELRNKDTKRQREKRSSKSKFSTSKATKIFDFHKNFFASKAFEENSDLIISVTRLGGFF